MGERRVGAMFNGYEVQFYMMKKRVLETDGGTGCTTI